MTLNLSVSLKNYGHLNSLPKNVPIDPWKKKPQIGDCEWFENVSGRDEVMKNPIGVEQILWGHTSKGGIPSEMKISRTFEPFCVGSCK